MLLWVDGFEKYGEIGDYPSDAVSWKYSYTEDVRIASGSGGGKALEIYNSDLRNMHTPALTSNRILIFGFAFKIDSLEDETPIVDIRHPDHFGSTVGYHSVTVMLSDVDGTYQLKAGIRHYGNFGTTNTLDLQVDTWYYLEVKIFCDETSGTFEMHLDGEEVLNYTGDTQYSGAWDLYSHIGFKTSYYCDLFIDDLYICDGSGNTNNDFLGTCNVKTLSPSSDVSGNWTPSTGNAMYATINEDVQDANYISSNVSGSQAIFETNNLAPVGDVVGVAITTDSQISGNLYKHPKLLTQNGSGDVQTSANIVPGLDNPIGHLIMLEKNPDGDEWTRTNINDLRIGVEVS